MLLDGDGIVLVEWGDVVAQTFGDHLLIRLDHDPVDDDARFITLTGTGRAWALRWERLEHHLERFAC